MTNYRITSGSAGLAIELTDVGTQEEQLLSAFAECQQGQCSCPTDEYQKLETMDVIPGEGEILIQLRPKEGASFDISELSACLDYTVAQTADGADGDPER